MAALAALAASHGALSQVLLAGAAANGAAVPNYTTSEAGNPFVAGWYADPDTAFYEGAHWVYPTASAAYEEQTYLDAFSSPDLVRWTKHPRILTTADVSWATKAMWAPAPVARHGRYYLYFAANDIQEDEAAAGAVGGIGVAVADAPGGPYADALGRPLIGKYHHGAQPIDQGVFVDDDGQAYMYYGGHGHANVVKLNEDMTSLGRFNGTDDDDEDDEETDAQFLSITPEDYVEGALMMKRRGVYYFMWSEGGWQGADYRVAYATASSPLGPFRRASTILQQDDAVARGSGHHGVVHVPGTDIYYIVYHRRPLRETDGNHRVLAYDRMYFDADGAIAPVRMRVRDNFADGNMLGWKPTPADRWAVRDDDDDDDVPALVVADGGGRALLDTNFTDVVADARVAVAGPGRAGVLFRAAYGDEEPFSGYFAGVEPRSRRVLLGKTANGSAEHLLAEAPLPPVGEDGYYALRATAVGGRLRVFVDDLAAPLIALTDGQPLGAGANGVAADGAARFGNVSVARPDDVVGVHG